MKGYIGVDLDGTLAHHSGGCGAIGKPIKPMLNKVKQWLKQGKKVKIFTARGGDSKQVVWVKEWLKEQGLPELEVTNIKDSNMIEFWDDKAVGVKRNKGVKKSVYYIDIKKAQPTEAQKEAGNYKKKHISVQGLDISIENAKGLIRSGTDRDGKEWKIKLQANYGYIKGTKGKDKDHIDVFVGDNQGSETVFIVNQIVPRTGQFDEHKVMLGYSTEKEAKQAYLANYERGWKGLGSIKTKTIDEFKQWLKGDTTKMTKHTQYFINLEKADKEGQKRSEKTGRYVSTPTKISGYVRDKEGFTGRALSITGYTVLTNIQGGRKYHIKDLTAINKKEHKEPYKGKKFISSQGHTHYYNPETETISEDSTGFVRIKKK